MRRVAAVLVLALLPLTVLGGPAQASRPDVCAGTGQMMVSAPNTVMNGGSFTFEGSFGVCAYGGQAYVQGSYSGSLCTRANGLITGSGHTAPFSTASAIMVISGRELIGRLDITPAIGQSCLTGATVFQVTGILYLI